jgi:PAS domain S-box-containing protein
VLSILLAAIYALLMVAAVAHVLRNAGGRSDGERPLVESPSYLRSLERLTDPALGLLPLDELLQALLDRMLVAVGGDVVTILLIAADGESLYIRAGRGTADLFPDGAALSIRDGVLGDVAQWTRPIVIEELREIDLPVDAGGRSLASMAAAPLLVRGSAVGVMEVGSVTRRRFEQSDVRLLQVSAERCSNAIEHARLSDSERRNRLGADHARRHLDILARAGTVLGQALESYDAALEEMGNVLVPDFADWFSVDVLDDWGDLRRVTTAAIGHSFGTAPGGHPDGEHLVRLAINERRPQVVMNTERIGSADIGAGVHPLTGPASRRTDIDSMLVVPVKVRDEFAGAISFVTGPGRRGYRPSDLKTAIELADRVGVAIDRVVAWREAQVAGNAALGYAQRLQQLVEAGLVVNAQLAEEEVLELLAEHAHRVLDADLVAITVGREGEAIPERIWPPHALRSGSKNEQIVWKLAAEASEQVARTGLAARSSGGFSSESGETTRDPKVTAGSHSWLAVPIVGSEGECSTVVVVLGQRGRSFSDDDESVLTLLAQMASVALQNATLYADVRSNERRLQAVVESSPLAIAELDLSGDARWWNRAAGELFGWTNEARSRRVTARDESELVLAELWERTRGGKATSGMAISASGPEGLQLELSVSTSPLSEQGKVTGMLFVADDVTEWRRILDQFHQAERLGAMTRMAGAVAHDFNNLLTVILGCSEVLMHRVDGDEALAQEVSAIQRAGSRAAALTNQLVTIGQQRPVQPEVVDIEEVITSIEPMISGVLGENVELDILRYPGPTTILIDRSELERSFLNLAINARDAMPDGGRFTIEISHVSEQDAEVSASVRICVTDTGTGIEPDVIAHCFEPFFTTKGRAQGTGLGLATVHATVTKAGGEIRVESSPGSGTRFTISFPAHELGAIQEDSSDHSPLHTSQAVPAGKVILFVDDEPEVLRLAVSELERRGYSVIGATNSSQALSAVNARNGDIDLLITDIVMPGMSGIELADAVTRRYAKVPILYVSGHLDEQVAERHPLPDGAELLPKPFTPDELSVTVLRALSREKAKRTPRSTKSSSKSESTLAVVRRRVS